MIEFTSNTPTIAEVYNYTYSNKITKTRFFYEERDVLKSKFKIQKRIVYKKNKEGKFTTPDERLFIYSESAPQYSPYIIKKRGGRQLKYRHSYDIIMCIQKSEDGKYDFWKSKIIWRTGSQKKIPNNIPQNKVKSVLKRTRDRLEQKYKKLSVRERKSVLSKEFEKIRKNGKYLNTGDYLACEFGIMLDAYMRDYFIQSKFDCLYGKSYYNKPTKGINFPFGDKHWLMCIDLLMKKGIIVYR